MVTVSKNNEKVSGLVVSGYDVKVNMLKFEFE